MVGVKYIHAEAGGFETFQEQPTLSIIISHFSVGQDEQFPLCLPQNATYHIKDLYEKAEKNFPDHAEARSLVLLEMLSYWDCQWPKRHSAPSWDVGFVFLSHQ